MNQNLPTKYCKPNSRESLDKTRSKVQRGLTLVELLVALAISTVITIAAFSALIVSRQGFTATDVASQLRDNSRFATDLLQRLGVQAGYISDAFNTRIPLLNAPAPNPSVTGFNDALIDIADPENRFIARPAAAVDGSDILILRYQPSETFPASGVVDSSMVNCAGNPAAAAAIDQNDRIVNIFHIALNANDGEPSLMCTVVNDGGAPNPQPIIRGVETLQVLYGVNGVTLAGEPPAVTNTQNVATRYLRADQMVVPGNIAATNNNWRRVRSLKIGMVIRGPVGSASEQADLTYFPLGTGPSAIGAAAGTSTSVAADKGSAFRPGNDSRLRQVVNFTIHLRNFQEPI